MLITNCMYIFKAQPDMAF